MPLLHVSGVIVTVFSIPTVFSALILLLSWISLKSVFDILKIQSLDLQALQYSSSLVTLLYLQTYDLWLTASVKPPYNLLGAEIQGHEMFKLSLRQLWLIYLFIQMESILLFLLLLHYICFDSLFPQVWQWSVWSGVHLLWLTHLHGAEHDCRLRADHEVATNYAEYICWTGFYAGMHSSTITHCTITLLIQVIRLHYLNP